MLAFSVPVRLQMANCLQQCHCRPNTTFLLNIYVWQSLYQRLGDNEINDSTVDAHHKPHFPALTYDWLVDKTSSIILIEFIENGESIAICGAFEKLSLCPVSYRRLCHFGRFRFNQPNCGAIRTVWTQNENQFREINDSFRRKSG